MVRRRPSASQALLIGFVICYMMSVAPFFVYARYRMPVVPVLLLYAAHWVVEAAGEMSRKRLRAVAIRLVLTGLFALLVWVDSYGARRVMRGLRHEDYWVAGNGYMISGRYEEAAQYYRLALKEKPDYADAWLNLGKTLIQAGDCEGAADAINRLLAIDPDNTSGLSNAAVIAEKTGDPARAQELWRRALEIEPHNAPALLGLGDMLRVLGRLDEAEPLLRRAFEIRPEDFEAAVGLALLCRARGDAGSFALWAEKARSLNRELTDKRLQEEAKSKVN